MDMSSAMKVEVPKVEAKIEAPKVEALKVEAKVEAPKVEAPKVETPKVEALKVEAKVEAPKVEAPKVEAPNVKVPKVEAPKVEAPKVEAPTQVTDSVASITAAATATVCNTTAAAKSAAITADGAMEGLEAKAEVMKTAAHSAISDVVDDVEAAGASLNLDGNPFSSFMAQISMLFDTCMKKTGSCMNGTGDMAESAMESTSGGVAAVSDMVGEAFDEATKTNP